MKVSLFLVFLHVVVAEDRCTAIIVGKAASSNGHPMTTHTNDCSNCDFRIAKVPAADHSENATISIPLVKMDYPRYVGKDRGPVFYPENFDQSVNNWQNLENVTQILGELPQVNHTYAYIDGLYGIMNEHQLSIGESTCGGRLVSKPIGFGGKALLDVTILSRLALQRYKTAREAIEFMGQLAEQYGYYGAVYEGAESLGEAGEALTVADPNEAWVFHIHPDDTGASAVWVAQRVPDGHISVVANQFIIRQVNLSDSDNFIGSSNLETVATRAGLYNATSDGEFDFTKAYALRRPHGLHLYSTRRVWRLFTLSNPEIHLDADITDPLASDYPFSVPTSRLLTTQDIMKYQRDHYEGTPYDMTQGPAAGPYGNPDRYDVAANGNLTREEAMMGQFERAISIFRTSYSFVSEAAPSLNPKLWFGPYAPHATTYIPIYANVDQVPEIYSKGSLFKYDPSTAYWTHSIVGNWVSRFYRIAIPFVQELQHELESKAVSEQKEIDDQVSQLSEDDRIAFLTKKSQEYGDKAHSSFTTLFGQLVTVFHDGYHVMGLDGSTLKPQSLFYPKWWLNQVGYFNSKFPETQAPTTEAPSTQAPETQATPAPPTLAGPHGPSVIKYLAIGVVLALFFTLLGVAIGKRSRNKHEYAPIH